jgi:hypothetical protein
MTTPTSHRWRIWIPIIVLVAAGLGIAGYFAYKKYHDTLLPSSESKVYQQYLRDFQGGVAALDIDQYDIANEKLSRAIETVPAEPAAWANRGLLKLRSMQIKEASNDLAMAHKLAPDNGPIETLLGVLAENQGHLPEAVGHFTKAVAAQPHDAVIRYKLVQLIEAESADGSNAKIMGLLDDILKDQPNNLYVLQNKVGIALRLGDKKALSDALAQLKKVSAGWSKPTREAFEALEKSSEGPITRDVTENYVELVGPLRAEPGYERSSIAVLPLTNTAMGRPVYDFIKLQPVQPTTAPADMDLTFQSEPLADKGSDANTERGHWSTIVPVWLTRESSPVIFLGNETEIRRLDDETFHEPFPSGVNKVPPTIHGVLPLDWNNDYRMDLLFSGAGGLRFLEQDEKGAFTDVTARTKLDPSILKGDYYGAWAADVDMDGDLDIILAPRSGTTIVLRNNNDGTFTVIKPFAGIESIREVIWADFDNDGAPDAAMLDAQGRLHLFANERSGLFREVKLPALPGKILAITAVDADNGGALDILALADTKELLILSQQTRGDEPWKVSRLASLPDVKPGDVGSNRLIPADMDNNGGVDIIVSNTHGTHILLKLPDGNFQPLKSSLTDQALWAVDLNKDGRLDILALGKEGQALKWINHGAKNYQWQVIRPRAEDHVKGDQRINSFGIGGEIEVRSGQIVQKQMITVPDVHFGLGDQEFPDVLRVVWPNGSAMVEFDQPINDFVVAKQRLSGSCPFLFTHDAHGMQFVADCTWSTPLGMYINAQDKGGFLQTTDWVKIRGDQLAAKDGAYDVRITANLWETHFLDYMTLMTVDHPPGTEIYVDERFAITPSEPHFVVTKPARPVKQAWDDNGNDVTDIVSKIDGQYLDNFGRGKYQGVTRDHFVELDLGEQAQHQRPVYLLANGWVHPTDSSINVAISQGSNEPPHPIVLEVPDGKGGWKLGRNDIGFPAGKNKTIVIRLDGIGGNPEIPRRVRLRTNMEIYWDALLLAEGLETSLAKTEVLKPDRAELRHHGISLITTANRSSPELPHYDKLVSRGQYWRDLIGYYTRYGDVRELLEKVDDRYVIMNAGDELAFHFKESSAPRAGWKRDFVWISDGWVKDGNLNTRFSKTVLPLPYHGMQEYITPPGRLPDDPVYQRFPDDWQKFHTRYVTPDEFKRGLRPQR